MLFIVNQKFRVIFLQKNELLSLSVGFRQKVVFGNSLV